jgi:hypothetical protein
MYTVHTKYVAIMVQYTFAAAPCKDMVYAVYMALFQKNQLPWNTTQLSQECVNMLGKFSDGHVAKQFGVSEHVITKRRKMLKITPSPYKDSAQRKPIDLTDQRFGKLVAVANTGKQNAYDYYIWQCRCDCGRLTEKSTRYLRGKTKFKACTACTPKGRPIIADRGSHKNMVYGKLRQAARQRGHELELSKEEVIELVSQACFYCGEPPPEKAAKNLHGVFKRNGVDRIDSSLGYVTGNVRPCCFICNCAKNDLTETEFKDWLARVYRFYVVGSN